LDVTWYGHGCFRLRGRGAAVVNDPYPPALGTRLPRLEADLVTISHEHDNHNYVRALAKDPFLIRDPGEYEVAGVTVIGVPTFHDVKRGEVHGRNTVYLLDIDDVTVCHLGDLGHPLDDRALERLGKVDVLLVPVGGGATLDATRGAEVVRQIEPRYVVPMHYALPQLQVELQPIDRFLEEMGVESHERQPKLTVQASSSSEGETKVVLLEPRA
jgi:L-ascorbate metabolism protein UlaG (beta-lactamase superfamily)